MSTFDDNQDMRAQRDELLLAGHAVPDEPGIVDLVATLRDGASDQLLVGEGTVHVRGVQEVHARVEGRVDHREGLLLVTSSVELGHPHTAQTLRGDLQRGATRSERATRNSHDQPPCS